MQTTHYTMSTLLLSIYSRRPICHVPRRSTTLTICRFKLHTQAPMEYTIFQISLFRLMYINTVTWPCLVSFNYIYICMYIRFKMIKTFQPPCNKCCSPPSEDDSSTYKNGTDTGKYPPGQSSHGHYPPTILLIRTIPTVATESKNKIVL